MTDVDRVIAAARRSGDTLTANPREHIARARRILARGQLSELLYAALELRLALERITQTELVFSELASNRMLDQYSASKKVANLRKLAPESEHRHDVEIRHAVTGEWSKIGEYRPLDQQRANEINGRLGDLLHAKDGLALGMPDREPWYRDTYVFLCETVDFLGELYEDNTQFFSYEGLEHIRLVRRD
ncbi:MAG: hypothetical protein JXA57_02865 [Armatimonadetes bacterium]|nr:hypothetical protein [Armatimonadota bacterium]